MIHSTKENWARHGNQELVLDYIRRLETERGGRRAVYVSLSSLPPSYRRPHHIHAATASLESLVKRSQGQLFVLENADLIFVYETEAQPQVKTEIRTLQKLLGVTLALKRDRGAGGIENWLDLETSYEEFLVLVRGAAGTGELPLYTEREPAAENQDSSPLEGNGGVAATRETVSRLAQALRNADLSNLLRRQVVYALGLQMYPRPLFREFYYSIPDLSEAVLSRGSLMSNKRLFRHTTHALDKAMLSSLMETENKHPDRGISINLNLSTILSDNFSRFDKSMDDASRNAVIIEIQCADIVSEVGAYMNARAFLQERGYGICIDGVTSRALEMVEHACPGVDFIKIHWDPELVGLAEKARAGILLKPRSSGEPRLVITRVGTPDAVAFGQSLGIELFQGRYIDAFVKKDRRWRDLVRLNRKLQTVR